MGWAGERLDALKAGTVELMPVVKTLRLGALDDWRPGWVRKVWEPIPELLQSDGTMFGGYLAALADQTLAFATMSVLPDDQFFRTVGLSVQFFRGSRNERITIEARVVAQSRQLIAAEAEFRNPSGDLIAKATAQQVLLPIPRQAEATR
jgi:uncharacterized protein (TIGR00369 family)